MPFNLYPRYYDSCTLPKTHSEMCWHIHYCVTTYSEHGLHHCEEMIIPFHILSVVAESCSFTGSNGNTTTGQCSPSTVCCGGDNENGGPVIRCCPGDKYCGPYHKGSGTVMCLSSRKPSILNCVKLWWLSCMPLSAALISNTGIARMFILILLPAPTANIN